MEKLEGSEVFQAIKDRRSVRAFLDTPVADDTLLSLLEAGRWAPSGGNKQPVVYIVVRDPGMKRKIKAISPGFSGDPGAVIVACIDRRIGRAAEMGERMIDAWQIEIGMATQNIMLQAQDLGLGTCAIRSFNMAAVRRLLRIPDSLDPELVLTVGYPARVPKAPRRRPLEEIVYWESYETAE